MSDQLAYDSSYQTLVLSECLNNLQFRDLVAEAVTAEQFGDKALQWMFDTITQSSIPLTKTTLKEELIKAKTNKKIRAEEVDRYLELYKKIIKPPTVHEQTHLRETLSKFIRTQNCKKAVMDSFDLIKEGKWEEFESKISAAVASGVDLLALGQDYFTEYESRLERRELEGEARKLGTGIPELDIMLNGGIKNKQVGLIVGGSGQGKSLFLSWLAHVAVVTYNKTVVYFTMELPEDDIAERLDSMVCHIRPTELRDLATDAKSVLAPLQSKYGKQLWIKEYPPDYATVNTLKTYYKQLQSQGITPDLVIVDYLDLVKPHRIYDNMNQEMDATVKALCGFAKELDVRIWTASQLNRGGMVAETPDESSIAGAIDKLFNVDIAIFMARNKEERELEEMRLVMIKSRNGPSGRSIRLDTDYGYMTFYREAAPAPESSSS